MREDMRAAQQIKIDFTGLQIPDIVNAERVSLQGRYTADSLIEVLVREWVPAMRCVKCGRSDYCTFVYEENGQRYPIKHIECGACAQAILLFVRSTFPLVYELDTDGLQAYLDGTYHLARFFYASETRMGACLNEDMVEYWSSAGPMLYTMLVPLRDMLDKAVRNPKSVPGFERTPGILFVEGESERAFLAKLGGSRGRIVDVYEGNDNRRPRRIEMLLARHIQDGYSVFMQADADGKDKEQICRSLIEKGYLKREHVFIFSHDLETAFPPGLLLHALHQIGRLQDIELSEFKRDMLNWPGSVAELLGNKYQLDIGPLKVEIAVKVAEVLNSISWHHDERMTGTELGEFLAFVRRMP